MNKLIKFNRAECLKDKHSPLIGIESAFDCWHLSNPTGTNGEYTMCGFCYIHESFSVIFQDSAGVTCNDCIKNIQIIKNIVT